MRATRKAKGEAKNLPFDPILFAATAPARKSTEKDLDDIKAHESDPTERKDHRAMDDAVADL